MKYTLPLLSMLWLFAACHTPRPIPRISPIDASKVHWEYGAAFVTAEPQDLHVQAAFVDYDAEMLFFDVKVTNTFKEDILVSPEVISLLTLQGYKQHALDPEAMRMGMDLERSRQEASQKNWAIGLGMAAIATTVAVAATTDTDDDGRATGGTEETVNDVFDVLQVSLDAGALITATATGFGYPAVLVVDDSALPPVTERMFWTDYTLRRTTLTPGEEVRGIVVIPRVDATEGFDLMIPIQDVTYRVGFEQLMFLP